MATTVDRKIKGYCDTMFHELSEMKRKVLALEDELAKVYGIEDEHYEIQARHLCEISDFIDWKLQILVKACPYDWKGLGDDVETIVSVRTPETASGPEISGGYLGG